MLLKPRSRRSLDRNPSSEVYPPSLANAVRYAHAATGVPILATEHGVGTNDDAIRAELIPAALLELQKVVAEGIPVKGYLPTSAGVLTNPLDFGAIVLPDLNDKAGWRAYVEHGNRMPAESMAAAHMATPLADQEAFAEHTRFITKRLTKT